MYKLTVLVFLHALVDFYGGLLLPLLEPTLIGHYGVSLGRVMLLVSSCAILINIVQPLAGGLLPRRRLPLLLWICPLLASLACLIGLDPRYSVGWVFMGLSAIGVGLLHPEAASTAQSLAGTRMGLTTSFFMSFGFLGFALGSLVGGWWGQRFGLDFFWVLALPGVVAAALVWISGLANRDLILPEPALSEANRETLPFGVVFALSALIAINMTVFFRIFPVYWVRRFGADAQAEAGRILFLIGLAGTFGSFAWGALSDRFGAGRILALVYMAGLAPALILVHRALSGKAYLWAMLFGFTVGGSFPLAVVLARRAKAFSARLRLGLCIGGAWGLGELCVIGIGALMDRVPADNGEAARFYMQFCPLLMLAVTVLALAVARARMKSQRKGPALRTSGPAVTSAPLLFGCLF